MNRYDRSPLDQCIAERDRFQDEVSRLRADLKRHKEALEKARVALEYVSCHDHEDDSMPSSGCSVCQHVEQALSTINDLLDKSDKKG